MRLRLLLFILLGMMYYGYIRNTGDKAMAAFTTWQTTYLRTIDQAAAGNIPEQPSALTAR